MRILIFLRKLPLSRQTARKLLQRNLPPKKLHQKTKTHLRNKILMRSPMRSPMQILIHPKKRKSPQNLQIQRPTARNLLRLRPTMIPTRIQMKTLTHRKKKKPPKRKRMAPNLPLRPKILPPKKANPMKTNLPTKKTPPKRKIHPKRRKKPNPQSQLKNAKKHPPLQLKPPPSVPNPTLAPPQAQPPSSLVTSL